MGKIDKQKEIVGFWRIAFFAVIGALFGSVAYLFERFESLDTIRLLLINSVIFFFVILLVFIARTLIKEINKLEEMQ